MAAAPREVEKAERDEGCHTMVSLPREEEKPVPVPATDGVGTPRFINDVGVEDKMNSGKGVIMLSCLATTALFR